MGALKNDGYMGHQLSFTIGSQIQWYSFLRNPKKSVLGIGTGRILVHTVSLTAKLMEVMEGRVDSHNQLPLKSRGGGTNLIGSQRIIQPKVRCFSDLLPTKR